MSLRSSVWHKEVVCTSDCHPEGLCPEGSFNTFSGSRRLFDAGNDKWWRGCYLVNQAAVLLLFQKEVKDLPREDCSNCPSVKSKIYFIKKLLSTFDSWASTNDLLLARFACSFKKRTKIAIWLPLPGSLVTTHLSPRQTDCLPHLRKDPSSLRSSG